MRIPTAELPLEFGCLYIESRLINGKLPTCSDASDERNSNDPVRITRSLGVSGQAHGDERFEDNANAMRKRSPEKILQSAIRSKAES